MTTYKTRDEIPAKYKWNLQDVYTSQNDWDEEYSKVERAIEMLSTFENQIHNGKQLYNYLMLWEETLFVARKLSAYAMLNLDLDTTNSDAQTLVDKIRSLSTKFSSGISFFTPFLLEIPEEKLAKFFEEEPKLAYFEKYLRDKYRYKKHTLSKENEGLLSQLSDSLSSSSQTFNMINNADIKFGEITNEDGTKQRLTRSMYSKLIESKNREVRKEAYLAYYEPYVQLQNTIASTLSSAIKTNVTLSKIRKYPSALERALFADDVDKAVFDNLIQATEENLHNLHRYVSLRKEILKYDELLPYDLSVPLVEDVKLDIPYEEAYDIMVEALKPLGEDYIETLKSIRDKNYIDVYPTPGKKSGAYNLGVHGVHPYVLLNYNDKLDNLFTLAHEMGHCMHAHYSSTYQPRITASYSIFVAEVASTVNEILVIRHLLKNTTDANMKKYLTNHFLNMFKGTYFTQVMFSEFEKMAHEKAANNEPLTAKVFSNIYEQLTKKYNGPALTLLNETKYSWARIPHFYRPFYVYKYATGFASAIQIADSILDGNKQMVCSYLNFLKSGGSDFPIELLKNTGVDLTTQEQIDNALRIFGSLVDDLAAM